MARPGESREDIRRVLAGMGWEVRTDDEDSGAVMGAHGKHHLMVNFEGDEPTSVLISYVGRGGEILSTKWPGTEHLPTPRSVVRGLSKGSRDK
jgi:hypothetical protein